MNDPLFFLYADNYRTYNVEVAKKLGSITAAIFLGEICQRNKYHSDNGEFISDPRYGDNWFYYTGEKCEERTGMTVQEQRTAYKLLIRLGLIEQANFGVPCKKHFRIDMIKILEFFGMKPSNNVSSYAKSTNWMLQNNKLDVANQQTAQYIEEPYKEPKEEEKNPLPPKGGSSTAASFVSYREHVSLKPEEHEKLVNDVGKPMVEKMLNILDAYKGASGKRYKSDYSTMKEGGWVRTKAREESKTRRYSSSNEVDRRTRNMDGTPVESPADKLF